MEALNEKGKHKFTGAELFLQKKTVNKTHRLLPTSSTQSLIKLHL